MNNSAMSNNDIGRVPKKIRRSDSNGSQLSQLGSDNGNHNQSDGNDRASSLDVGISTSNNDSMHVPKKSKIRRSGSNGSQRSQRGSDNGNHRQSDVSSVDIGIAAMTNSNNGSIRVPKKSKIRRSGSNGSQRGGSGGSNRHQTDGNDRVSEAVDIGTSATSGIADSGSIRVPKKTKIRRTGSNGSQTSQQGLSGGSNHQTSDGNDRVSSVDMGISATGNDDSIRVPKKTKIRRSGSNGSQRSKGSLERSQRGGNQSNQSSSNYETIKSASINQHTSPFDSSDEDEGGQQRNVAAGMSIGPKKRLKKSSEESKKRSRGYTTNDDDGSDGDGIDDSQSSRRKKRREQLSSSKDGKTAMGSIDSTALKSDAKRKKRTKAKGSLLKEDTAVGSDDEPMIKLTKNKKVAPSSLQQSFGFVPRRKLREGTRASSDAKRNKKELKPLLAVGDQVYAAWWPDLQSRRTDTRSAWYAGTITSTKEVDKGDVYGPIRYYSITYDDGDSLKNVKDVFVFPKYDYLLNTQREKAWIGVKTILDSNATDEWARKVGWCAVLIDGEEQHFSLLSDALRAYDASVVDRMGPKTKPSFLNLPNEWEFGPRDEPRNETIPNWKGVYFHKQGEKYVAKYQQTRINGRKAYHLGYYMLASDAALAHDEALRLLKVPNAKINFATDQEHENARAAESSRRKLNVDFDAVRNYMSSTISHIISKARALDEREFGDEPRNETIPNWKGVHFHNQREKYVAKYQGKLATGGKACHLGYYMLASDAALAYDEALRLLKVSNAKINFATDQEHENARAAESSRRKLNVDFDAVRTFMSSTISNIISKARASDEREFGDEPRNETIPNWKGVYFHKQGEKYVAKYQGKSAPGGKAYHLGYYMLASDAALAHDEALRLLKVSNAKINFATDQEHENARAAESSRRKLNIDFDAVQTYMSSTISHIISKARASDEREFGDEPRYETMSLPDWKGVSFIEEKEKYQEKYQAIIIHGGKACHLGYYMLASDAALAHDEALRQLKISNVKPNFATDQDHKNERAAELSKTGKTRLDDDFDAVRLYITSTVSHIISKFIASSSCSQDGEQLTEKKGKQERSLRASVASSQDDCNPRTTSKLGKIGLDLPQTNLKRKRHSDYVGFSYSKPHQKYTSNIRHDGVRIHLGLYSLETDAALSHDVALEELKSKKEKNFFTLQDYEKAKKLEMERKGFGMDATLTSAAIKSYVKERIRQKIGTANEETVGTFSGTPECNYSVKERPSEQSINGTNGCPLSHVSGQLWKTSKDKTSRRHPVHALEKDAPIPPEICPEIAMLNAAMAKKYASHLPPETGQEYIELYKKGIDEIFQDLKPQGIAFDTPMSSTVSVGNELSDQSLCSKDSNEAHNISKNHLRNKSRDENIGTSASDPGKAAPAQKNGDTSSQDHNKLRAKEKPNEYIKNASTQKSSLSSPPNTLTFKNPRPQLENQAPLSSANVTVDHSKRLKKPESIVPVEEPVSTVSFSNALLNKDSLQNQSRYDSLESNAFDAGKVITARNPDEEASQVGNELNISRGKRNKSTEDGEPVLSTVSLGNALSDKARLLNQLCDETPGVNSLDTGKAIVAQTPDKEASQVGNELNISRRKPNKFSKGTFAPLPSERVSCENPSPKSHDQPLLSAMNANAMHTKRKKKIEIVELTINQVEELDLLYPVGCSVWFQFDEVDNSNDGDNPKQSFRTGVVSAVLIDLSSRDIMYKVSLTTRQGTEQSEMIPEYLLHYAPRCPVSVSESSSSTMGTNTHLLQGEILMCMAKSQHDININVVMQLMEQARLSNISNDFEKLIDILDQFASVSVSHQILSETFIGKYIVTLESHSNDIVGKQAHALVEKWKGIANEEKDQASHSSDNKFSYFYTILIVEKGNQFHVADNVSAEHVQYRKVPTLGAEETESSHSTITTAPDLC